MHPIIPWLLPLDCHHHLEREVDRDNNRPNARRALLACARKRYADYFLRSSVAGYAVDLHFTDEEN